MNIQSNSQKIEPFLWFDRNAEEAVNFYVSIFDNAEITAKTYYGNEGAGPEGTVMTIGFTLDGVQFSCINGGPQFKFTEAISLVVHCSDQSEVDRYWDALLADGGSPVACGWLKDKFGLFWQVVPDKWIQLMSSGDSERISKGMKAMMQMVKLEEKVLLDAYFS